MEPWFGSGTKKFVVLGGRTVGLGPSTSPKDGQPSESQTGMEKTKGPPPTPSHYPWVCRLDGTRRTVGSLGNVRGEFNVRDRGNGSQVKETTESTLLNPRCPDPGSDPSNLSNKPKIEVPETRSRCR